jgi:hypothetical protein
MKPLVPIVLLQLYHQGPPSSHLKFTHHLKPVDFLCSSHFSHAYEMTFIVLGITSHTIIPKKMKGNGQVLQNAYIYISLARICYDPH